MRQGAVNGDMPLTYISLTVNTGKVHSAPPQLPRNDRAHATPRPAPASEARAVDLVWTVAEQFDPGLQARRLRRVLTGTSAFQELRAAVAGRRVLVTGASSGIGQAVALECARAGAVVLVVARRADLLDELVAEIASACGEAYAYPCDLSDEAATTLLAQTIIERHGGVDVLVNNAGRSIRRSLRNSADRLHDFDRVMRLNYFGMVWLTLPLVDHMRRRGGCHVVNVSTLGTQVQAQPRYSAYIASKCAMDGFTRAVAPETLPDQVTWSLVNLPLVRTDMIAPTRIYAQAPALSVEKGADMVLDAIRRRPTRVTHPLGTVSMLVNAVIPKRLDAVRARGFRATPRVLSS